MKWNATRNDKWSQGLLTMTVMITGTVETWGGSPLSDASTVSWNLGEQSWKTIFSCKCFLGFMQVNLRGITHFPSPFVSSKLTGLLRVNSPVLGSILNALSGVFPAMIL